MAIGHTQGQLKELEEKSTTTNNICDITTEYSIVEVLKLWQTIFRETFQQYHRLSSRLVKSQDSVSALKLWNEYLQHVQSYLASAIPEDYSSLTEHRHLCEVHENLLTSQQSVLSLKNNVNVTVDPALMTQFNYLSNFHDETLTNIINRHGQIENRLAAWHKYRSDQANLLSWLQEKEKERSRLQLRYIHLRRVPKVLQRIERLIEQLPQGEVDADNLKKQQLNLLTICDETLATSIRMEHVAIVQRISNLRAALETWRDFLKRIITLGQTYDTQVKVIQSSFNEVQTLIKNTSSYLPTKADDVHNVLVQLRNQRIRLNTLTPELESISVIQEELKECISPFDMKTIRQMVWILCQQQADLDQQISSLINQIEEQLSLNTLFLMKYNRLMQWMDVIEKRLDSDSQSLLRDPEELIRCLEKDVQSEMTLREREKDWLLMHGRELISFYSGHTTTDKEQQIETQTKIDNIVERWERLKYLCKSRSNKIHDIKQTIIGFEDRITVIRNWLYSIEIELQKPIVFVSNSNDALVQCLDDNEKMQRSIEKESVNVGDLFNLWEMLTNDADTWKGHFNITALGEIIDNLEKKWKNVCNLSAERKRKIVNVWSMLQETMRICTDREEWLRKEERELTELSKSDDILTKDEIQNRIYILEDKIKQYNSIDSDYQHLEQTYSKIAKTHGLDSENVKLLTVTIRNVLMRWKTLTPTALDIIGTLNMDIKIYREFINLHGKSIVSLSQIDASLTQLQHLSKSEALDNAEKQLQPLQIIEEQLKMCEHDLENADKLGLQIMTKSKPEEIITIQILIDEYQLLWKDIISRITVLKTEITTKIVKSKEVDESVQVETLRFETDSAVQVNTLPGLNRLTSVTPKDAYMYELTAAVKECRTNLDALDVAVNDPNKKPGSQVVSKLISNSESSVELMNHLSTILITECYCTNEEAQVHDVAELFAKYETLIALWKAKERQQQQNRYVFVYI